MNIRNVAMFLAVGNVTDETPIQYHKLAYLLLPVGAL